MNSPSSQPKNRSSNTNMSFSPMTLSRAAVSSNIQSVLNKAGQTSSLMSAALNPSSFGNQRNKLLMFAAPN